MWKGVYVISFLLLFAGCLMLCMCIRWLEVISGLMRRGREEMNEAARKRLLDNRRRLLTLQKEHSLWYRLEQELNYSGWKRKIPFLTAELWLAVNVLCAALIFILLLAGAGWKKSFIGLAVFGGIEYIALCISKARAFRRVNANLLKFLDFLGNYSITTGEITGVFQQISKYMDEPLKSVLDECSYEAQTTGDISLALLSMAEKVEHPKVKELVRNMEISSRYSADFTLLVNNSRRSVREYLRMGEERKSLVVEAFINMAMLLGMSVVTLLIVDRLIQQSIWVLLFSTVPGWIALGVILFIVLLFAKKVYKLNH